MTATTHAEFDKATEAKTVAAAFPTSIKGRTVVVTGVNKLGIGYATAEAFASQGAAQLILAGRTPSRVQECADALKQQFPDVDYRVLQLDLASQKSVRAASDQVLGWADVPTIDLVINNAGIMNIPTRTFTEDDIEIHIATNHVGHFLFTNLISPKIIAAAQKAPKGTVRIVNLSSSGVNASACRLDDLRWETPASALPEQQVPNFAMMRAHGLKFDEEAPYNPVAAYASSKTANVLFSVGLNDKLYAKHGVLSIALNPGEVKTELARNSEDQIMEMIKRATEQYGLRFKTIEEGASTTLVAATDPQLTLPDSDGRGVFLSDCQISDVPGYAVDKELALKLWEITEGWVGEKFAY